MASPVLYEKDSHEVSIFRCLRHVLCDPKEYERPVPAWELSPDREVGVDGMIGGQSGSRSSGSPREVSERIDAKKRTARLCTRRSVGLLPPLARAGRPADSTRCSIMPLPVRNTVTVGRLLYDALPITFTPAVLQVLRLLEQPLPSIRRLTGEFR